MLDKYIADFMEKVDRIEIEKKNELKRIEEELTRHKSIGDNLRAQIEQYNKMTKELKCEYDAKLAKLEHDRQLVREALADALNDKTSANLMKRDAEDIKKNIVFLSDRAQERLNEQERIIAALSESEQKLDKAIYENNELKKDLSRRIDEALDKEKVYSLRLDKLNRKEMRLNELQDELGEKMEHLKSLERTMRAKSKQSE